MPLAIVISMLVVMGCYLLCNIAYIAVLGPNLIKSSSAVALVRSLFIFAVGDSYNIAFHICCN